MRLLLTISGLCLFVPKRDAEKSTTQRMHLLLPKMPGHIHGAGDEHVAVLSVDTAHFRPGCETTDGVMARLKLFGKRLAIPDGDAASAELALCPEIVDLAPIVGGLDPDEIDTAMLMSHVIFGAGHMGRIARGACWDWIPGEKSRPLAHKAEWIVPDLPDGPLVLVLEDLESGEVKSLPPLHLLRGGDTIQLFLDHLPAAELESMGKPDEEEEPAPKAAAPHFHAYFALFDPDGPSLLPRYHCRECKGLEVCTPIPEAGGSPFNCMLARVGP